MIDPQQSARLEAQFAFLNEADRLKSVLRATTLCDASRRENTAEHSWHIALYAMVLGDLAPPDVTISRVVEMLILHDLVEIDVGDVPIHSADGKAHDSAAVQAAELAAAKRIFGLLPADIGAKFLALWLEFEANATPDAIFAKSLDRSQPLMANLMTNGVSWREYNVTFEQIETRVGAKIDRGIPRLWQWLTTKILAHEWFRNR